MQQERKIRVILVDRNSTFGNPFSLSVECRLIEPFEFIGKHSETISWSTQSEQSLLDVPVIEADLIWFSKGVTDAAVTIAQKAKAQGVVVFFDLDDWIMGFPEYSGIALTPRNKEVFQTFMEISDEVTVANERLLHEIRPYRSDAEIVTVGFYLEKYWAELSSPANEVKKIVFTNGGLIKLRSFKSDFIRVLDHFFQEHPEWSLDFYGQFPVELEGKTYINAKGYCSFPLHKQHLLQERYALAIIPLGGIEDKESFLFHACKSPVKYLDYAGLGIPGVYSCVPIYEGCVIPEHTGILVPNSYEAWREALETLATNDELRSSIRVKGFEDVKSKYHIRYTASKMEALVRKHFC